MSCSSRYLANNLSYKNLNSPVLLLYKLHITNSNSNNRKHLVVFKTYYNFFN